MTFRYQAMAIARDVLTISAVVTMLSGIFWFIAKPYLQPWLELPERMAEISLRIAPLTRPQLIEFNGPAMLLNGDKFEPGDTARLLYHLRRNADCATEIEVSWIDVETGAKVVTGTMRAVQAPVTEDFTSFILALRIPANLPDGRYSYFPRLTPLNCGIYRSYNAAMSEVFEVAR